MIDKIKTEVKELENKKINFKYNGSRNQIEEFEGVITNCYKAVFLIKGDNFSKTYSYTDVLIGALEINI